MNSSEPGHVPVLLEEAVAALAVQPGHWYVDATFGRGGHTKQILKNDGKVIAFDHDEEAIIFGKQAFMSEIEKGVLILIHANFEKLIQEVGKLSEEVRGHILGVLADLGISSTQLDSETRGFSFQVDSPLDMRMDQSLGVTAKDLVNGWGKRELQNLFSVYAQERNARTIAEAILKERAKKTITTTKELADLIERVVHRTGHLHPATKVFMALRMQVNNELDALESMLPQAVEVLEKSGRIVIISFHEGEDRIVKTFMKEQQEDGRGTIIVKKPIEVSPDEKEENMRSRSAKMRIFEKNI